MWSALAELGITKGCRPELAHFCPHSPVTRAQVASFLVRALELAPSVPFGFTDTGGSVHKAAINSLAAARITNGCDAWPLRYCPRDSVRPGQMASFLARAPRPGSPDGGGRLPVRRLGRSPVVRANRGATRWRGC